ncbi:MAG: mechanosensitive ion channel, partial [Patescibacteria group bacterium]|nr:mechanosensitive ion channel [Patescibacteria group bacterium]
TLSDQVNRLVVQVGIAYGSDTELATRLLLEAAKEHPRVLADPGPRVSFEEFGDSSLKFVLRCYLPDLEDRLAVIHDLHMSVDRKFRQAGVEIAFPQRDIHVRSLGSAISLFDREPTAGESAVGRDGPKPPEGATANTR